MFDIILNSFRKHNFGLNSVERSEMNLRGRRIQFRIECLYNLDRSLDVVGNKRRLYVLGYRVSVFPLPT